MKTSLIALSLALGAVPALGNEDGWVQTSRTGTSVFEVKAGSFEKGTNGGGEGVAAVTGRVITGASGAKKISLEKWYVRVADCKRGRGKIVTLSLSGEFQFDNDFIFDGGNIASANAEVICLALNSEQESSRKKSL